MSTVEMSSCDHGVVAKVKRCIMERDLYPRRWGLGPVALEKKKLKEFGKLDKFGRTNDATPSQWTDKYKDYGAPAGESSGAGAEPRPAAAAPAASVPEPAEKAEPVESKKSKKHKDETPEERAERKRRKAEKKEKKVKSEKNDESD